MLAIKLKLSGRKNQRTFRVIVQEGRAKLDGKNVEDLGWYNPHTNQFKVNRDRADYWISNGAQPTDSAAKLLEKVKSSDVGGYEAREGRKKKKGPVAEAGAESAPQVAEGEVPENAETAEEPEKQEEAPKEEAPAEEKIEETEKAEEKEEAKEEPQKDIEEEKEG